jgi:hypothetical protein
MRRRCVSCSNYFINEYFMKVGQRVSATGIYEQLDLTLDTLQSKVRSPI